MQALFYKMLIWLSRRLGEPVFIIFSWFVASGYFFLSPAPAGQHPLLPGAVSGQGPAVSHRVRLAAVPQLHHGVSRSLSFQETRVQAAFTGDWEEIETAILAAERRHPSHVARGQLGGGGAPAAAPDERLRLLLYMGRKHKEQIERIQKAQSPTAGSKSSPWTGGAGPPWISWRGWRF